jgi:hypothetical protein
MNSKLVLEAVKKVLERLDEIDEKDETFIRDVVLDILIPNTFVPVLGSVVSLYLLAIRSIIYEIKTNMKDETEEIDDSLQTYIKVVSETE